MPAAPVYRIPAGVNESFRECLCHMLKGAEIRVVASAFGCQQGMKGMMKVVVPLSIQAVPTQLQWPNDASVVERAFSDHVHAPIQRRALLVDGFSQLFKKIQRRVVENGMNCIQAQG